MRAARPLRRRPQQSSKQRSTLPYRPTPPGLETRSPEPAWTQGSPTRPGERRASACDREHWSTWLLAGRPPNVVGVDREAAQRQRGSAECPDDERRNASPNRHEATTHAVREQRPAIAPTRVRGPPAIRRPWSAVDSAMLADA